MNIPYSYVYFAFKGDAFDPDEISKLLEIQPSDSWEKGDKGKYTAKQQYACWKLQSVSQELLDIDSLINEVIDQLEDKVDLINETKAKMGCETVLEIVMQIDINDEVSAPFIGHDKRTISFLYQTGTTTDIDIYRYDSTKQE